ncbi:MAG: TonB-dependent receptor [Gammaproteobacteria bacterium]|nr:TonB-dependent receptor [Gammaproteobacteria bacterium]
MLSATMISLSAATASLEEVTVTARRRSESLQQVPLAISVIDAALLGSRGTVNTRQAAELVPTLYYNSANPRNTAYTLRGLGSNTLAISAANDGMEPGVGYYVDDVYHGRPASASFDFVDIERIEVLRGPQGTLFGKNTTAGAIHVIAHRPTFTNAWQAEVSRGGYDFLQARLVANAKVAEASALRLAAQLTTREGVLRNAPDGRRLNALDNRAVRLQWRHQVSAGVDLRIVADASTQRSACCTQTFLRVGESLRSPARQFAALAKAAGYVPPSTDAFERLADIDGPLRIDTRDRGLAAHLDWTLPSAAVTAIAAHRQWDWDVENDRDYIGLPIQTVQRIPSLQRQDSLELRYTTTDDGRLQYVGGLYAFAQRIVGKPTSIYGAAAARWLLNPASFAAAIPADLLEGYGQTGESRFRMQSLAGYGEANLQISGRLTATLGLRYTREDKHGTYATQVFGGPSLAPWPAQTALELERARLSILRPQSYAAAVAGGSVSGRASLGYRASAQIFAYVGVARGYKSGGLNMSGLPLDALDQPALATAVIDDERNDTLEAGLKWRSAAGRATVNLAAYRTRVTDYQANIVSSLETAALRSYPANIPEVRVTGVEIEVTYRPVDRLTLRASLADADGRNTRYPMGPCPLERQTAATSACDLGGVRLAGLSRTAATFGLDYRQPLPHGELVFSMDTLTRSGYPSDTAASRYTWIEGYRVSNAHIAYRAPSDWQVEFFARNLFAARYITALTIQTGNSGLILGQPGDPRLVGITLRRGLR